MRQSLFYQRVYGKVVGDIAAVVKQSILTVAGIGIKRDIGDNTEPRD